MNIKSLYSLYAQHPEGQWVVVPENAESLYKFVMDHPVKKVLDLGTGIGCSSAIIALAFKDKGETDYEVHTVEQNEKCIKLAKELTPQELQEHIVYHYSPVEVWQTEHIPYQHFSTYKTLPEGSWDMVVNDGPSPFMEGENYIELPNGTITKLLLEGKLKPGTFIIWDGRISALSTLERYYGGSFYLAQHTKPDFNVLERKDNPIQFDDLRKENIVQNTTYFKELDNPGNAIKPVA